MGGGWGGVKQQLVSRHFLSLTLTFIVHEINGISKNGETRASVLRAPHLIIWKKYSIFKKKVIDWLYIKYQQWKSLNFFLKIHFNLCIRYQDKYYLIFSSLYCSRWMKMNLFIICKSNNFFQGWLGMGGQNSSSCLGI